jgi:hypothetical protein
MRLAKGEEILYPREDFGQRRSMDPLLLLRFVAVLAATFVVVQGTGLVLVRKRHIALPVLGVAVCAILLAPLLMPSSHPVFRLAVAAVSASLGGKLFDLRRSRPVRDSGPPGVLDLFRFFANPFTMVFDRALIPFPRSKPRAPEGIRLALGLAVLGLGGGILLLLFTTGVGASMFIADHVTKVLVLAVMIEGVSQAACASARLTGVHAVPVTEYALLARTPASFWRRYNRMAGVWLYKHVFRPAGGRRKAVRAVLLTFLANGILHEYLFGVALLRISGYQLAFFLLQGLGVLGSAPLDRMAERFGWVGEGCARLITTAFLLLSSLFFFASLDSICPGFYSAPRWLP